MEEERKTKFCSNCGGEIDIKAKICPKCGVEQPIVPGKVSNWWYLVPIFFGIIGGLIAWIANRDRNPKKAFRFLIIGIIIPIIWTIIYFGVLSSIVLVSLEKSKEKAKDTRILADLMQIRTMAQLIYSFEESDYSKINCTHPDLISICASIEEATGEKPTIHSTRDAYCAYIKLLTKGYYCIDSKGNSRETSIHPGGTGYCDGITFVCP